jgi:hypothetical protein
MSDYWQDPENLRHEAEAAVRREEFAAIRRAAERIAAATGWTLAEVTRVAGVSYETEDGRINLSPGGVVFKALERLAA